jgi:hypothetical protein
MYFFYFSIINMFSFFLVFFHKLFLIERRKEEQERQMLEMLHMTGPPESPIFGRSKRTSTDGRVDDGTGG